LVTRSCASGAREKGYEKQEVASFFRENIKKLEKSITRRNKTPISIIIEGKELDRTAVSFRVQRGKKTRSLWPHINNSCLAVLTIFNKGFIDLNLDIESGSLLDFPQ